VAANSHSTRGTLEHGFAPANPTPLMRSVMTVIYVADGARVGKADTPARQDDLGWWLPGLQEGDLVGTHLNPVVYP
jgi:hypothetical protein